MDNFSSNPEHLTMEEKLKACGATNKKYISYLAAKDKENAVLNRALDQACRDKRCEYCRFEGKCESDCIDR